MTVPDTEENAKLCVCSGCPSFPQDCGKDILYCARGKSGCDIHADGCLCSICAVYSKYDLSELYYCDKVDVAVGMRMRKVRPGEDFSSYQKILDIKQVANLGTSIVSSMGSPKKLPYSFSDLQFVPAQVYRIPVEREVKVNTETIIGKKSKKPLKVSSPIMISGMSLGATSVNSKLAINRMASGLNIAYNSGEGGILDQEFEAAPRCLIGQYTTDRADVDMEILRKVAAVEIRFGQGAYPGKGSYLPGAKISPELMVIRGLKGPDTPFSPAHHFDMETPAQIADKVGWLREQTYGVPIGAKIGCGNVEKDIGILVEAGIDYIALDGFGGGTGATEYFVRENTGLPIIAALPRAARYLEEIGARENTTLIAGGGLRSSADFAKCLALGADAVYIATAALIALGCEQYRMCHTGLCPTGVTTHNPALTGQLDVEKGAEKLSNFVKVSTGEIANLARIMGKTDVHGLNREDLISLDKDLASLAHVRWLDGNYR